MINKHGRARTYNLNGCRCDDCRQAMIKSINRIKERRKQYLDKNNISQHPTIIHGTYNGYNNFYCRCPSCREAKNIKEREYRRNKKQNSRIINDITKRRNSK